MRGARAKCCGQQAIALVSAMISTYRPFARSRHPLPILLSLSYSLNQRSALVWKFLLLMAVYRDCPSPALHRRRFIGVIHRIHHAIFPMTQSSTSRQARTERPNRCRGVVTRIVKQIVRAASTVHSGSTARRPDACNWCGTANKAALTPMARHDQKIGIPVKQAGRDEAEDDRLAPKIAHRAHHRSCRPSCHPAALPMDVN
jgi:hypothetical protein